MTHVVILDEARLRQVLATYAAYYNQLRAHRSLNKDTPRFIASLSASAPLHRDRSSAAFNISTAEFKSSAHTPWQNGHVE